jgi:hypothetical protein
MAADELILRPTLIDSVIVDPAVIESMGGRDDHVSETARIEPGAAQDRRHDVVVEQLVKGRLIAAAIDASVHRPLQSCETLCNVGGKRVVIVTRDRKFRGNLTIPATQLPFRWNPPAGVLSTPRSAREHDQHLSMPA